MPNRIAQVEIIVFKIIDGKILFLMLKRNEQNGGFWQPISGGINKGESLVDAVKRELFEETGIVDFVHIYENVHYFEFNTEKYGVLKEHVFGMRVAENIGVKLSSEHTEMKWCSLDEAMNLLKYNDNKIAFKKLFNSLNN